MSKKDKVFELFSQGKTLDSPEVTTLELVQKTSREYYRLWQKIRDGKVLEDLVGARLSKPPVPVGSLPLGAQFVLERKRYRKTAGQANKVSILHLTNPEMGWIGVTTIGVDPSTVVLPI